MVRTLFLRSLVLGPLAALAVAQNMSDSMTGMNASDSMNGMNVTDSMTTPETASAMPMDVDYTGYTGASGKPAHPGMTPGVLSPDGKCWCSALPAMPTGHMPSDVAPPSMPMVPEMPVANTTIPPTVPATTPNTTDDTTTSGVTFLKGSSNACFLAAAAVVGITTLAA
ncbi:uncharacterized protein MELLADRAFT_85989 [Melampsora larici-populina 98AG31]|uniref:Secreted protein n=1 Tax=Melampsora larici-populina (strain 98AG31 / pathotype 3-4-7) TaxID=747676 RepID=F4RKD6_MELLP|nr:uncharacterized protein MELLADRAFT_85989 [Melampsora larici-populina 98AG31]EGG07077.1 secreted protein [Melampsora larici-populina 98AG31]